MLRLTIRQRFAITFSIYVFCFLLVIFFILYNILNITVNYQLKNTLSIESTEIINNHLLLSNKSLIFQRDEFGASLREYLLRHDTSAVFLDANKQQLRAYGQFALNDEKTNIKKFQELTSKTLISKELIDANINWNSQQIASVVLPLKYKENIAGFMILGKSLNEFNSLTQTMSLIFASLGLLSLIGSFFVGYMLARWTFLPLNKIIRVIEGTELDNLDFLGPVKGHPNDEMVRLTNRFNEMILRLKDMSNRQKAFVANASHELKTPLTRAISSLDLLSDQQNGKDIQLIREDLFSIDSLFEKLLLLSKLKKDVHFGRAYWLNTHNLFNTLSGHFDKKLSKKHLKLVADLTKEVKIIIPKDYLMIILTNLLSNSIKYSKPKTNITLTIHQILTDTTITIRDEGVGMTEDEKNHMFDRFYRAKNAKQKGYGIGLSLVKQLCDLYDIKIQIISEKDKGTSISLLMSSKLVA